MPRPACLCLAIALCAAPALAQPQPSLAQGAVARAFRPGGPPAARWFIGLEAGYVRDAFEPAYTFIDGTPPESFENLATGAGFGALVGYNLVAGRGGALGLIGRFGISRAIWTLDVMDTPGFLGGTVAVPSSLTYKIPYTASLALQPRIRMGRRASLLVELGAGVGNVDELKTSSGGSTYHFTGWQPFWELGAGASVGLRRGVAIYGMYRWAAYSSYSFESRTPAGAHWESIQDAPRTQTVTGGLTFSLGR